jgi:hypothetical protein
MMFLVLDKNSFKLNWRKLRNSILSFTALLMNIKEESLTKQKQNIKKLLITLTPLKRR